MIEDKIAKCILTVGPEYADPKGGVAQCLQTYECCVFPKMKILTNSCNGNVARKSIKFLTSILKFIIICFKDEEIRIVHIHSASYNSFRRASVFVYLSRLLKKRIVLHIHGGGFKDFYKHNVRLVDQSFSKCSAIVALSPSWKFYFQNEVGLEHVWVIPNVIDVPTIVNYNKDGLFHLLYLGHINKSKGVFDLVEMLCENKDEYIGKLVLDIGGGMYDSCRLFNYIECNRLDALIRFHGWVSGDKKVELFNTADAFILPSYVEGVPISILEAESYGLPIISTYVGGIPEIVSDTENGFLFEPGDRISMKQKIDLILGDPVLRKQMSESSKERSIKYMPTEVAARLTELYSSLLKKSL